MSEEEKIKKGLSLAVEAICFCDSSDYENYLWRIVNVLGGADAEQLLENDEEAAIRTGKGVGFTGFHRVGFLNTKILSQSTRACPVIARFPSSAPHVRGVRQA